MCAAPPPPPPLPFPPPPPSFPSRFTLSSDPPPAPHLPGAFPFPPGPAPPPLPPDPAPAPPSNLGLSLFPERGVADPPAESAGQGESDRAGEGQEEGSGKEQGAGLLFAYEDGRGGGGRGLPERGVVPPAPPEPLPSVFDLMLTARRPFLRGLRVRKSARGRRVNVRTAAGVVGAVRDRKPEAVRTPSCRSPCLRLPHECRIHHACTRSTHRHTSEDWSAQLGVLPRRRQHHYRQAPCLVLASSRAPAGWESTD